MGPRGVCRLLLERGADVNKSDKQGDTALHEAARADEMDAVELLGEWEGVDVDAKNKHGCTALHVASHAGLGAMVKLLVRLGSCVHGQMKGGYTSLTRAAANGSNSSLSALLESGANIRHSASESKIHRSSSGTALELAEANEQEEAARMLRNDRSVSLNEAVCSGTSDNRRLVARKLLYPVIFNVYTVHRYCSGITTFLTGTVKLRTTTYSAFENGTRGHSSVMIQPNKDFKKVQYRFTYCIILLVKYKIDIVKVFVNKQSLQGLQSSGSFTPSMRLTISSFHFTLLIIQFGFAYQSFEAFLHTRYTLSHFGNAYAAAVPAMPEGSTMATSSATPRKQSTPLQYVNV